jgi:LmbE family N-acetylglucosaminyl deacetylase
VLAAHPDDEVVGAAVLLARSPGCRVIYLTDGVPRDPRHWPRPFADRDEYLRLRGAEGESALALAGIGAGAIHRLGGVDQDAPLEIARLARDLTAVLAALRPTVLVLQPYEGGHPDHDAAAVVGRAAAQLVARLGLDPPRLLEMTSYHARQDALAAGVFLADPERQSEIVPSEAELALKRRMLALHESQAAMLGQLPAGSERFRRAPPADFSRPPHAGELYYERMGWMRGEEFRSLAAAALDELSLPPLLVLRGGPSIGTPG